jgi:D-3-phosphoglycerate dehydrogenase
VRDDQGLRLGPHLHRGEVPSKRLLMSQRGIRARSVRSMAATTSYPKDKIKVLLLENIHQTGRQIFAAEGFQVEALSTALPPDELARRIADVHVLGIRSKTRVTAEALANARRLLALGCFCIGTNQVALDAANERGIPVFNAPFSNTRSVAELAIAQIISLARHMTDRSREVHEGKWNKVATNSYEIRGKTLGIVGYGHIGRQLGVLAESMGMRVIFYDIVAKLPMGNNQAVETMDELLAQADFVTLHVPETPQTKNLIGANELARMKRGSYLMNLARGTVVVIEALADALKSGHLAGAAIDVYPEEPESNGPGFKTPLQGLPNVILTPHIAGSTSEAQAAIGREVATALTKLVNTGATTGAVNFPQVELPQGRDTHRILNVHRNVPGVLRDINRIVSERNANIQSQLLATDPKIGYVIMDLDRDVSQEVYSDIAALPTSIRTRILY